MLNHKKKQIAEQLISEAQTILEEADLEQLKEQVNQLQNQTLDPKFWQKSDASQIMESLSLKRDQQKQFKKIKKLQDNLLANLELSQEVEDLFDENPDLENNFLQDLNRLNKIIKIFKLRKYLSGKYDHCHCFLSVHSGQGGTEAMDWAEMLSRMYIRYFENKGWDYQYVDESKGEDAGIKEVMFEVKAVYAYGYLKRERGTHRLVRLSPFNADNLRQTSFALVEVLPIIEQDDEIKIKDSDLSWNFSRSGGAGGQSVNKVNSAVELTHIPTNIVVKCREERKQFQNKQRALQMLRSKLALRQEKQIEQELAKTKGEHQHASWGTQIRNYVLHPYHLVKDTRTGVETNDTQAVLDGDLDQFIEEEIKLDQF